MYDVIVIGAGPAGLAAGITCAQNKLKTFLVAEEVPNIDHAHASFLLPVDELGEKITRGMAGLEILIGKRVSSLEKNIVSFSVEIADGTLLHCRTVIIATGDSEVEFESLTAKNGKGKIKVSSNFETSVPGIFAAGSVIGTGWNAELAAVQGLAASYGAAHMLYPPELP